MLLQNAHRGWLHHLSRSGTSLELDDPRRHVVFVIDQLLNLLLLSFFPPPMLTPTPFHPLLTPPPSHRPPLFIVLQSKKAIKRKGSTMRNGERKYFKIPARGSKEYVEIVAAAIKVQRYWRQYYAIRHLRARVKERIKDEKQQKKDAKRDRKLKEKEKRRDAARRLHGGAVKTEGSKTSKGTDDTDSVNSRPGKPLTKEELRTVGGLLGTRTLNRKVVPLKLKQPEKKVAPLKRKQPKKKQTETGSSSPGKTVGKPGAGLNPKHKVSTSSNSSSKSKVSKSKKPMSVKRPPRRGSKPVEDEPEEEIAEAIHIPNLRPHEYAACMLPSTFTVYDWVADNPNYIRIGSSDERKSWAKSWPEYLPTDYTSPSILEDSPTSIIADDDLQLTKIKFNAICKATGAPINRVSHSGKYALHPGHGMPLNPGGRTNIQGRGVFRRYGPNHGAEMILSRWKRKGGSLLRDHFDEPMLEVLMIKKGSSPEWQLPGNQLASGAAALSEHVILETEFERETKLRKMPKTEKTHLKEYLTSLCNAGKSVFNGLPDDPRNTDNAWAENSIMHYHDKTGQFSSLLKRDSAGGDEGTAQQSFKARANAALPTAATVINSGGGAGGADDAAVLESPTAEGAGATDNPDIPCWVGIAPGTLLDPCIEEYVTTIRQDLVAQTGGALAKRRKRVNLKKWNVARGFMMERAKLIAFEKNNPGNMLFKYAPSNLIFTKENRATLMKCIKPSVLAAELKEMLTTQAHIQAADKERAAAAAAAAAAAGLAAAKGEKAKGKVPKLAHVLYSPTSEARCLTESVADYDALELLFKAVYAPNPLNFDAETFEDREIVEARAKAAADVALLEANAAAIAAATAAAAAAKVAGADNEDAAKDANHLILPDMDPSNPHHHLHQHHHKLHGPGTLPQGDAPKTHRLSVGRENSDLSRQSTAISARSGKSTKSNVSGKSGQSVRSNASGRAVKSAASNRSSKSANFATAHAMEAGKAAEAAATKADEAKAEAEAVVTDGIPAPRVANDALTTNLDILDVEVPALVIRCELSRNLPGKFPIAMSREERLAAEERMASVFEVLATKKAYAGTYYSFTPDTKHQTLGPVLQTNLESHGLMMSPDVLSDVCAMYPTVADDWPSGRGMYVADNNSQFVVWVGEVDQIKVITQKKGKEADETFELGKAVLNEMTAILRALPPPPEPEPKATAGPRLRKRRSTVSTGVDVGGGGGGGDSGGAVPPPRARSTLGRSRSGMETKGDPLPDRSRVSSPPSITAGLGTRGKTNTGLGGRSRTPGASRRFSSKEPSHLGDGGFGEFEGMLNSAGSHRPHPRSARSARSVVSSVSSKTSKAAKAGPPPDPLDPKNESSGWAWDSKFGFLTVDPNGAGAAFSCSVMMVFRANRSPEQVRGYCYKAGLEINNAPNRVKEANSRSVRIQPRRFYGQSDRAVIGGLFSGIRMLRKMMVIGPKAGGKGKGNLRR